MTLTPLLLHWFHATNNSFSIIQFIARHKWNSKDNAVANEHGRCSWLHLHPGCQRKERIFILRLPHIPIKTRMLHFQACGINVIYKLKETDGGLNVSCGNAVQWYLCSQGQWRNPPKSFQGQITSVNTCSCASIMCCSHTCSYGPDAHVATSCLSFIAHAKTLRTDMLDRIKDTITIPFIYPGLSVNHSNNQN